MTIIKAPKIQYLFACSAFIIFLAIFSYFYLDRPVVEWAYSNSRLWACHKAFEYGTHLMPLYYAFIPWFILYIVVRLYRNKQLKCIHLCLLLMFLGMSLAEIFNIEFKIIFGRYWAVTWYHNNLSWISNQAYGFNFLKFGQEYHSFPSGHTAGIFGFMAILFWHVNNKVKIFGLLNCLAVALGLILMAHHYLSDVLIGSLVGIWSAYFVLFIYQQYSSNKLGSLNVR